MFVIRSMSTTDYDFRANNKPEPYHVYLMPSHKRTRAYWSHRSEAQQFATVEEAEAEIDRALTQRDKWWRRPEIAPADDRNVPTLWANQVAKQRQVGNTAQPY